LPLQGAKVIGYAALPDAAEATGGAAAGTTKG